VCVCERESERERERGKSGRKQRGAEEGDGGRTGPDSMSFMCKKRPSMCQKRPTEEGELVSRAPKNLK
jgi:hypothetical protein